MDRTKFIYEIISFFSMLKQHGLDRVSGNSDPTMPYTALVLYGKKLAKEHVIYYKNTELFRLVLDRYGSYIKFKDDIVDMSFPIEGIDEIINALEGIYNYTHNKVLDEVILDLYAIE